MATLQRRHRFYGHLLLLSLGVMLLIAFPYPVRRLSVLCSEVLILMLTFELGRPLRQRQHKHHWYDNAYRLIGLAAFGFQLLWLLSPVNWRFTSGVPVLALIAMFVFWSLKRLLYCLSCEKVISAKVISGAVAGYLLLGITGGLFFSVLETVAPGSFVNTARDHQGLVLQVFSQNPSSIPSWMLDLSRIYYFAFVSLTTVGYGDIVPTTPTAQMASVALSISGPLYLALVMGLLISRYTIQSENKEGQNPRDDD
uniref:potassium channel family protein n=1 Tax=Cyanobium sp. TaxID=2164130 RepID=UPI00404A8485